MIMNEFGNITDEDICVINTLLNNEVPESWKNKLQNSRGYKGYTTVEWLGSLLHKFQHIERLILTNKDKISSYWLGAFQKPESFLSMFKEDILGQFMRSDRSGNFRDVKYLVEFINKDKDHIRDPPTDGIYVYGLHLWGCGYDKSTGELIDTSVKGVTTPLPVAHITFIINEQEKFDSPDQYFCPIFIDSTLRQEPILNVIIFKEGVPSFKWMLRGTFITINPF